MNLLIRVQGASKDLKIMYPSQEEVQLNFCTLIDLEFTSFSSKGDMITQFELSDAVALKVSTQEVVLQLDSQEKRFSLQCIIQIGQSVWVSNMSNCVVMEHSLDYILSGQRQQLETITEESEMQSPIRMIDRYNDKENNPNNSSINRKTKKNSPQRKSKSPTKTKRNKKTTFRSSKPILQTPKSLLKGDYVDALLAQLIHLNTKKNKHKKQRPSTSYPLRPKIDNDAMIDRQWLEEEMINEDL